MHEPAKVPVMNYHRVGNEGCEIATADPQAVSIHAARGNLLRDQVALGRENAELQKANALLAEQNAMLLMQQQSLSMLPHMPWSWSLPDGSDRGRSDRIVPRRHAGVQEAVQANFKGYSLSSSPKASLAWPARRKPSVNSSASTCATLHDGGEETTGTSGEYSFALGYGDPQGPLPLHNLTTVMMRNIPNNYTRALLLQLLDESFYGTYDLVYLPIDFKTGVGLGYAFINFLNPQFAEEFGTQFQDFTGWALLSEKVCEVSWSDMLQGLDDHIERYRNSPVMHESVPDDFKPALFRNGVRIPFPGPTRTLRAPRPRSRRQGMP